jgi:cystathionine beta-lyase
MPSGEYFDSIIGWQSRRNGVELTREEICYDNSVLGGVMSTLGAVCERGGKVLVHSPTYVGFTKAVENGGYTLVRSPLVPDADGVMRMDLCDMENKLRSENIRAAILCSPHNPTGRVWERRELAEAMALFEKYNVTVISDEIWSDLILNGHTHVPTHTVSDYAKSHTVSLYAITKTFNLAGLVGSYRIIRDKTLREAVEKQASLSHYDQMNVLSMHALVGAYSSEGERWLTELRSVLTENARLAVDFLRKRGISVSDPQGTYMLFLDCTEWCERHGRTIDELQRAGVYEGVIWQDGRPFFGDCHIRMNLALPTSELKEALGRLEAVL